MYSFVSQRGHLGCRLWPFDCILLVFSRQVCVTYTVMCSAVIGWNSTAVIGWNSTAVIGASFRSGSLCSPLPHRSPALFCVFDCWHSGFWYCNSTVPANVVRVKSYVNYLFHPPCVEMGIMINKHNGHVRSCRCALRWQRSASWSVRYPCCVLFSLLHRSASITYVNLSTLTGNPVDYTILFNWVDSILWVY